MAKTILLADDSLTIQKVVELTFAETDFDVVAVSSGDELLERMVEVSPDIVICDTIMPGTDGYDVCQNIKSDPSTLHVPVIMLTGTFEPFDRDRAMAVGCSEIVTKPFEARKLVETVQKLARDGGAAAVPGSVSGEVGPSEFEGAVAPPVFEGAVTPPPAEVYEGAVSPPVEEEEAYGTMMMTESPELEGAAEEKAAEGLDFTTSGFAAMEAAGEPAADAGYHSPTEGLEFEASTPEAPVADQAPPETPVAYQETQPLSHEDIAVAKENYEAEIADQEPFGTPAEEEPAAVGAFGMEPEEEESADTVPPEAFAHAEAYEEESSSDANDDTELLVAPYAGEPGFDGAADIPAAPEEPDTAPVEAVTGYGETEASTEPATGFGDVQPVSPAGLEDIPEEPVGTDIETGGMAELPEVEEIEENDRFSVGATTEIPRDVPTEPPPVAPAESTPAVAELSDSDIDRIARRVLELAFDRLEKIAWDIIPDMAEIVVRERIRDLEAAIDNEDSIH